MIGIRGRGLWWGAGGFMGCLSVAAAAVLFSPQTQASSPVVAREGLSLAGVPVAGKSREEVRQLADEVSARLLALPVSIRAGKRLEETTPGRLGASIDVEDAVEAIFAPEPPPANLLEKIRERFTAPEPVDVPLAVRVPEEGVRRGLARLAARVSLAPRDARLMRIGGAFKPVPPKSGRELDPAPLAKQLQSKLDAEPLIPEIAAGVAAEPSRDRWLEARKPVELTAPTREAKPRVTLEHLDEIEETLASYATSLHGSRNRIHNISLACKAIDGLVLLPGDTFSYNDVVGPRSSRAGFREAPQIVNGQLVPGTGGGVCQVSSTLFNAALLADMKIVRRSHHAFPIGYVPPGRDATVAYGSLDFKFQNRLEHPVAIDAKVVGGRVKMALYGHPDDKRQVEIISSGVGRSRSGGVRVTVTRVVRRDGEVLRREVVARDSYRPKPTAAATTRRRSTRREDEPASSERAPRARELPGTRRSTAGPAVPPARQGRSSDAAE